MTLGAADGTPIIRLKPIGRVERRGTAPDGPDVIAALRADPVRVVIEQAYLDGLLGLEPGDDVLVLTHLHLASRQILQVHPRGDRSCPLRGVFATRSPARPNPIGVTTAQVLAVDGAVLTVVGLDALDGSPVLDIKIVSSGFDEPYRGPDNT